MISPLVGTRSVVSILIVVVFPAPFGPKNANISPFVDLERNIVHGREIAEIFVKFLTSMMLT